MSVPASEPFANWLADDLPAIREFTHVAPPPPNASASAGKIRFAKLNFAMAALRLEELGVDVQALDMAEVVLFGRTIGRF